MKRIIFLLLLISGIYAQLITIPTYASKSDGFRLLGPTSDSLGLNPAYWMRYNPNIWDLWDGIISVNFQNTAYRWGVDEINASVMIEGESLSLMDNDLEWTPASLDDHFVTLQGFEFRVRNNDSLLVWDTSLNLYKKASVEEVLGRDSLTSIYEDELISNINSITINADSDSDGVGEVVLQTRGITRVTVENSGDVVISSLRFSQIYGLDSLNIDSLNFVPDTEFGNHRDNSGTDHSLLDVTPGTATASKALVVDASKDIDLGTGDLTATNLTGTLQTAAQTNITSVGILGGGSITSGFGAIDIGADSLTAANLTTSGRLSGKEIHFPPRTSQALVTFTFDDGFATDYSVMYPLFEAQGEVATTFIKTAGTNNEGDKLTSANLLTMQTSGWEIGSHSVNHPNLTDISADSARWEIETSLDSLVGWGLSSPIFAYPFGSNGANAEIRRIVRESYRAGVTDASGILTNESILKQFMIERTGADDHTALGDYQALVDDAETYKRWLIFVLHETNTDDSTAMATLIDYIQAKSIPIVTISGGLDLVGNFIDVGDNFSVGQEGFQGKATQLTVQRNDDNSFFYINNPTTSFSTRITMSTGDGTSSSRYNAILFRSLETTPQEWRLGMVGGKDFNLLNTTLGTNAIQVNAVNDNITITGNLSSGGHLISTNGGLLVTQTIKTTYAGEQLRLSYDATNYFKVDVLADGHTTFTTVDADGAEADMIFAPDGNVGIDFVNPLSKLSIDGGLHVGGESDAGDNNLLVDGTGTFIGNVTAGTVIANSNYVLEGYPTGRNVFRVLSFRFAVGSTPGTHITVLDESADGKGWNSPSITYIADLTDGGGSGGSSFSFTTVNMTLDLSETIVFAGLITVPSQDTENSSTAVYSISSYVSGGNIIMTLKKVGNDNASVNWLTALSNTGDGLFIRMLIITET